jgi:hypothetical protein
MGALALSLQVLLKISCFFGDVYEKTTLHTAPPDDSLGAL